MKKMSIETAAKKDFKDFLYYGGCPQRGNPDEGKHIECADGECLFDKQGCSFINICRTLTRQSKLKGG